MMRIQDTVKLSTRMFKTRPARTWLTILGIGVGISAVVVLVGLGFGLQGILLEKIVLGEAMLALNVSMPPSRLVQIDKTKLEEFASLDNVEAVEPLANFTALMTMEGLSGSINLSGVNANFFRYAGISAKDGALFEESEDDLVVLTTATAKLMGMSTSTDAIGKMVRFKVSIPSNNEIQEMPIEKDYKIKGIIDDSVQVLVYIPLKEFSSRFSVPYYEKARIKVTKTDFLDSVTKQVVDKGFVVTALSKTVEQANKIFQGVQVVLAIFGGIALVVSAIGMFNTMTVTLMERTNEIGIMRTIGGSPRNIQVLFLSESMVMGFLGGMVGILIGVGGGMSVNFLLNGLAKRMGGQAIALFKYPLWFLLFIAGFGAVMGFATGIFPARRASKLSPLDAIRYK